MPSERAAPFGTFLGEAAPSLASGEAELVARSRRGVARLAKRLLDLFGALTCLVLLAPVLAAIAVAIRMDSEGPAVFRQTRIGAGGAPFTFLKFRTMLEDNDASAHVEHVRSLIVDGSGPARRGSSGSFKLENDPRVTRLGRILRRSSIDELPQLVNVVRGEMSLVGPRPPLPYEVEVYTDRHRRRLAVLPGMTGLWQVSGRTRTTFEEMIDLDLRYIDEWSMAQDVKILVRTVGTVLGREGAW